MSTDTVSFPRSVELAPPGVELLVHRHDIHNGDQPVPCWTFVTQNLGDSGHPELVLSIVRDAGDDEGGLLPQPLELFKLLADMARGGRRVCAGEYTQLGTSGLFGNGVFCGITYAPALVLPDVPIAKGALTMVMLTAAELVLAQSFELRFAEEYCQPQSSARF